MARTVDQMSGECVSAMKRLEVHRRYWMLAALASTIFCRVRESTVPRGLSGERCVDEVDGQWSGRGRRPRLGGGARRCSSASPSGPAKVRRQDNFDRNTATMLSPAKISPMLPQRRSAALAGDEDLEEVMMNGSRTCPAMASRQKVSQRKRLV